MINRLCSVSKRINDTLGRQRRATQVLKELAKPAAAHDQRVRHFRRASAADRFAVVLPNPCGCIHGRAGSRTGSSIRSRKPLIIDDIELRTTVKVGIAVYPADAGHRGRACS